MMDVVTVTVSCQIWPQMTKVTSGDIVEYAWALSYSVVYIAFWRNGLARNLLDSQAIP